MERTASVNADPAQLSDSHGESVISQLVINNNIQLYTFSRVANALVHVIYRSLAQLDWLLVS